MTSPSSPANEACRLAALHALKVLDTPPEERFDRITRLARRLFDVPTVLVSLVDADRQWFKSRVGLDATETPRSISFCGHAILQDQVLIVPDARADYRFSDNPLVVGDPRIRFYAGCPLKTTAGFSVGTLCLIDQRPRELSVEDVASLKDLAETIEQLLNDAHNVMIDELTGLSNRKGLIVVGEYFAGMARRSGIPLWALVFDLDGFKAINDVHGHATGDLALAQFARALVEAFRSSDVVARLGGDEFCVLMSGVSADQVLEPIARLDAALTRAEDGQVYELAYSVGTVAFDPKRHAGIADVLDSADRAMYVAKRARHLEAPRR